MDRGSIWEKIKKALGSFTLDFCILALGLAGGIGAVFLFFERLRRWKKREGK
jgi:hypothetical protein